MKFSIIIPNYNGAEFLPSCLASISKAIKLTPNNSYEIILVDNGSTDNSISKIKELTKPLSSRVSPLHEGEIKRGFTKNCKLKVIKNSSNFGFATAINQGIFASQYPWVVLVNNDITLHPKWFKIISENINKLDSPSLAAVCSTVLNQDGSLIESTGLKFFLRGKCLNLNNGKKFLPSTIHDRRSKFIWGSSAALVAYKKETITKIGLFDENFFAYEEDVDLALRLHQQNFQTLFVPQAISCHLGGGTSRKMGYFRQMMDAKNWWLIILKNYSAKTIFLSFFPILEERLRNLSGLIKAVTRVDGLKSIYTLPIVIFKTYSGIFIKYDHWN